MASVPTSGKSQAGAVPPTATAVDDAKESTTLRFEWTVRGLKNLFEGSKGEAKSKVIKSPRFGDGRWQVLFYVNAGIVGTDGQTWVSLYLACEPTLAEKENAVDGKWAREGLFNFNFEIRNPSKTIQFNYKEAHDHSFYYPGAQNWGWSQFARRDVVYYQANTVRQHDAFLVICAITVSAAPPAPIPTIPPYTVPMNLLDTMGSLMDDPIYSDVEFIIPQRGRGESRKIYAARRMLQRIEHFNDMFSSGFAEAAPVDSGDADALDDSQQDDASVSSVTAYARHFDDSDFEDDEESVMLENDRDETVEPPPLGELRSPTLADDKKPISTDDTSSQKRRAEDEETPSESERENAADDGEDPQTQRNTRPKLSHPSSPRSRDVGLEQPTTPLGVVEPKPARNIPEVPGPKKLRVVVKDVAYATYRAVLYYIYTDMIVFAPLSSTFLAASSGSSAQGGSSVPATPAALTSEGQSSLGFSGFGVRSNQQQPSETVASSTSTIAGPRTRRDWVADWERNNPGRPRPPSAKSVYRLADRLGLQELKDRAFRHIVKSLTVENVAVEAFSAFSAAFEDVRKVQITFMFQNWMAVRTGALANIGQLLRIGKLPGFEEVWPMILQNLVAEDKKVDPPT
ncbi:hypothetical protein VTO73DRAFT_5923 [Trametes versicolor]